MFDRLKIGNLTEHLDYPARKVKGLHLPDRVRRRGLGIEN